MVLVLFVAGLTAVGLQVRCVDGAREAARLAARGDGSELVAARALSPVGAAMEVRRDGGYIMVRVSARSPILPGIVIVGEAVSAAEQRQ